MAKDENNQKQIAVAERLQLLWLERMEEMMKEKTITSTDMATLARVLMANGWSIDPSRLPEDLRDKLKLSRIDPKSFDDGDPDLKIA